VPVDDFVRRVSDVLTRADTLFGSGSGDAPAGASAQQLADAADAVRRNAGPDMAGSAVAGYSAFAQERASALAQLANTDEAFNQALEQAATAENTAAAASRSTVAAAAQHSHLLSTDGHTPAGHRSLIGALQSEVGRQQELVRRHHEQALELAEQVRQLPYG
jgi:hypothetical protein